MLGEKKTHRITVSVPEKEYIGLCVLSEKNDVSLSWLARHAISEFLISHPIDEPMLPLGPLEGRRQ